MAMLKPYLMITVTVFSRVAAAHLFRLIGGWPMEIAGLDIPRWVSIGGFVFPAALALWGSKLLLSLA